ncbi:MAG: hypothetical protein MJY96_00650 [Bacteroidaceae bacterium]|nr:hypothetical protein [Bacteroidaceae bacterium]
MRRSAGVLLMLCLSFSAVRAQYSINVDYKTVAAMTAAYAAGEVSEVYYQEQLKDILKNYSEAEVGAAGIFASKFLERKALTDISTWTSETENIYYRRIYSMVTTRIIPKIWDVGCLMIEHPADALNWGSYLIKTCDETKNLCMQFESVVTNSRLSFSDVAFLKVSDEAATVVDMARAGGTDWKESIRNLAGRARGALTKENLKSDAGTFKEQAMALLTTGGENLLQKSAFNDLFQGDISAVSGLIDTYSTMYQDFSDNAGQAVLNLVGGEAGVAGLFDLDSYSMTSWISDYAAEAKGTYYTQRWTIEKVDEGSKVICDYTPDQSKDHVINGGDWTRFSTSDPDFSPNSEQYDQIYDNSKRYTGVDVDYLLSQSGKNGDRYRITTSLYAYRITTNGKLTQKSYAYAIKLTHTWNRTETVYDEVFDSYRMDPNWFQQHMDQKLSDLEEDYPDCTFVIRKGERNFYQTTDEKKIQGVETAAITVTCSDGTKLAEGSTDYKCYTCESSITYHTRECSMLTSKEEADGDLMAELDGKISELQEQLTENLNSQQTLQKQIRSILYDILATPSGEVRDILNAQVRVLEQQLAGLKREYDSINAQLQPLLDAYGEAEAEANSEDEYYRIPAIMADLKTAFELEWQDGGHWSGTQFFRTAKMPDMNGTVTFKASLSLVRKSQYILGIKIHRAIIRISWELKADWVESTVADILFFDSSMTDAQKAQRVNERVSEIASMYPDCKVTVDYARSEPPADDETDDTFHLLWSSDRLEVAREVETRLTQIYADLVSYEKMMSYGRSVRYVMRNLWNRLDSDMGRRRTLIEECHDNWMLNAKPGMTTQ